MWAWMIAAIAALGAPATAEPDGVAAARALIASLDAASQKAIVLPLDAPDRRRWRRDPSPRPGVALKDMGDEQRRMVDSLLDTVLSDEGMKTVRGVRQEQEALGRMEEGLGAGHYWIAIYGEPGAGEWAWRLGGHHVSLHAACRGSEIVSATPMMLGGEVESAAAADWTGHARLHPRETLARSLALRLAPPQWEAARIGDRAPNAMELSEPSDSPLTAPQRGVELSALDAKQRETVTALLREYLGAFDAPIAGSLTQRFAATFAQARFAWAGSLAEGQPHYYRVQAPGFLLEYTNSGNHMHTLLRTDGDWGAATLPQR